ncbi:MAG: RluA family pseudouridine synthase [Bacteroidales bacterium]|nr:RluA family pseudouridine synthase [Bacteroidales bacterium]
MTDEPLFGNTKSAADAEETNELYEHYHFVVDKGQTPQRMDLFLTQRLAGISRNKVQMAAKAGCIRVNGKAEKSNYKVKPRDEISILLPTPPHQLELVPQEMPLDIVFEDRDVLVVNKPAGLVVHPGVANFDGTLLNGLLYHLKDDKNSSPYLVHRIDKDTSGLLLVAKNEEAQIQLAKQFFEHTTQRKYIALAWGDMPEDDGTVDANLDRDPRDRRIRAVVEPPQGKRAVTHWHVLKRLGYVTLVECVLETGRTHQIRAHMRHIGHPLFSDAPYGGDNILKGTIFSKYSAFVENCFRLMPRQALHAAVLGFEHPTTHQRLLFESPLPMDMATVIERWTEYADGSSQR